MSHWTLTHLQDLRTLMHPICQVYRSRRATVCQERKTKRILFRSSASDTFAADCYFSRSQQPRRHPDADNCEPCCKLMQTPCWIHSDSIPDEPVIPMATSSLPKVLYMDVCDESPTGKTVYVREAVMRHTVFGPLIAPTVFSDDEKARYVDVSDLGEEAKRKQYQLDSDYLCNWMKHVRLADSVEASNLLVFARGCEIVFVTSRTISPHEELRVWYSRQYLDLLNPVTPQDVDSDGEMSGVEAERRMPDSVIKEESFADHCGEKMLDPLSFQRCSTGTVIPQDGCRISEPVCSVVNSLPNWRNC
ncbi:PR domain zinc finger protein 10-like [Paramacrobiotus metropolitanus]|uniref:PR domain zinc finger protein 10-like n=1 Tax=Paramacrobiotus metropolitanus TaxID=2943436 RepID=UPI002445C7A5|nr:PR domain zinc finger protein 10-like [Paramacrobiotus metropolitanus]